MRIVCRSTADATVVHTNVIAIGIQAIVASPYDNRIVMLHGEVSPGAGFVFTKLRHATR